MAHSLLPNGFEDKLSDDAGLEGRTVEALASSFEAHGYERVKPPLMEFEGTLTAGLGESSANQLFRVPDPITNRMMAVRADMTVQVARIAQTRLAHRQTPMRLCYHGQVLRTRGEELRPERQFTQVGLELIGLPATSTVALLRADLEVLRVAVRALAEQGIDHLHIDVSLPDLADAIASDEGLSVDAAVALADALDARDIVKLRAVIRDPMACARLSELFSLPVDIIDALDALDALLPGAACQRQLAQARGFSETAPQVLGQSVTLTIDPTERRGSAYHDGLGYNLYARAGSNVAANSVQIGRGGRYSLGEQRATGVTIYMDGLGELLTGSERSTSARIVAVGLGADDEVIARLRRDGHRVLLVDPADAAAHGATDILTDTGSIEGIS